MSPLSSPSDGTVGLLRRANDLHEITNVLRRYCVALDSRAPELLRDCFTRDARLEFSGLGSLSPDAYIQLCTQSLPALDVTQHLISPALIDLQGDGAHSRCDFVAQHGRTACAPRGLLTLGGWYEDQLQRVAGQWRIVSRRGVVTWADGNPAVLDHLFPVGAPAWTSEREPPAWLTT